MTDVSEIPEETHASLAGLDLLILGALRWRPHPTHLTIDQAISVVNRLRPRRALFTHLCHDLDHATTCATLPEGIALAYDGMEALVDGVEDLRP